MVVIPVKLLLPDRVSLPPARVSPPVPEMLPAKVPDALVKVRLAAPSCTAPTPERDTIETSPVAAAIEKVPLSVRLLDAAMLPLPDSASVPDDMVVAPV